MNSLCKALLFEIIKFLFFAINKLANYINYHAILLFEYKNVMYYVYLYCDWD